MTNKILQVFFIGLLLFSCQEKEQLATKPQQKEEKLWNVESLKNRSLENQDSSKWDRNLLQQDIETYTKFSEVFQSFPLNKSPFPVAEYDYAVSSIPFVLEIDHSLFKGVRIGEYESSEGESTIEKLTLLVLTNDKDAEETTLVESRNYPYLTAQGIFKITNNTLDWVFSSSPDGYSTLLVNMKLFDLRFGETVLIYPQQDGSFVYHQLNDSPNNYKDFDAFAASIKKNADVKKQLASTANIRFE